MYRRGAEGVEVFLVHPAGPFFANRDEGVWGIPKGLVDEAERRLDTARREFAEETGQSVEACASRPEFLDLGWIVQRGGKTVFAWAFEGDWPPGAELVSNTFPLEWPPRSGRVQHVPEIDQGEFFPHPAARRKINPAQEPLIDRLLDLLV